MKTSRRKWEHIDITLNKEVEGPQTTWFEHVHLIHHAAPELNFTDIDTSIYFLNKKLSAPVMITGMTGGHPDVAHINAALAEVAEEFKIAMGVGSQRAAIENPELTESFAIVRKKAPSTVLVANIGAAQIVGGYSLKEIKKAVEMIDADAIAIHLNPAQEVIQPEGEPIYRNLISSISRLVDAIDVPVIVKETGCGLSMEVVRDLRDAGVRIFDVSGAGGTNWILVEKYRALKVGDELKATLADSISVWGIPSAASIIEARFMAPDAVIIGSGGIRTGIDAAKAIALGADMVGIARPALEAYFRGRLNLYIDAFIREIKAVMFLTGSKKVHDLRKKPIVITGVLREWMSERKIDRWDYELMRRGLSKTSIL